MNRLISLLMGVVAVSAVSCVSQTEIMRKDGAGADSYVYHYGQIGGQGTGQSSMGTAVAFDGQKSFADFLQMVTTVKGFSYQAKVSIAKEVTERYRLGQITLQQKNALDAALLTSTSTQQFQLAMAQILNTP